MGRQSAGRWAAKFAGRLGGANCVDAVMRIAATITHALTSPPSSHHLPPTTDQQGDLPAANSLAWLRAQPGLEGFGVPVRLDTHLSAFYLEAQALQSWEQPGKPEGSFCPPLADEAVGPDGRLRRAAELSCGCLALGVAGCPCRSEDTQRHAVAASLAARQAAPKQQQQARTARSKGGAPRRPAVAQEAPPACECSVSEALGEPGPQHPWLVEQQQREERRRQKKEEKAVSCFRAGMHRGQGCQLSSCQQAAVQSLP